MNKYLVKLAKQEKFKEFKPHQEEALAKLDKNNGLIIHHSVGSGKTFLFLNAAKRALEQNKVDDALIVAPASLVTNVDKELDKHKIDLDRKRLQVYSYEKANNISDELLKKRYSIFIADEAHKLRNAKTQRSKSLTDVAKRADKRLLATATANYNHSADISALINIAANSEVLPTDRSQFENKYIGRMAKPQGIVDRMLKKPVEEVEVIKRRDDLAKLFKKHVHYYDPKDDAAAKDKFPEVKEKYIETEMSPDQLKYYKFVEGQIPFWLRMKIRHDLPLDKQEKSQLNSFSQGVRQVSNSYRHLMQDQSSAEFTPKIQKAVESLHKGIQDDKNFKGLVYSNYLDAGVREYSRALKEKGVNHAIFDGSLNKTQKDKLRDDFNAGKMPVLLISSSGAEGLDLKGVKRVQVMDQHFNPSKIRQVVGRAARYESHTHLPKEERTVEVEHFLSTHPKGLFGRPPSSIDKYLSQMSEDKADVFHQLKGIMKENS